VGAAIEFLPRVMLSGAAAGLSLRPQNYVRAKVWVENSKALVMGLSKVLVTQSLTSVSKKLDMETKKIILEL
jgi:hypothetical protein